MHVPAMQISFFDRPCTMLNMLNANIVPRASLSGSCLVEFRNFEGWEWPVLQVLGCISLPVSKCQVLGP